MIRTDKKYPGTRLLLIPQGARVLGEAGSVTQFGQQRTGIAFHRIVIFPSLDAPDITPCGITLEPKSLAQDQAGANGLKGKVDNHFWSTYAAAAAVGGISGLSSIGGYGAGYSSSAGFFIGMSSSTAAATERVLDKYLNRPPEFTVPKGTRIEIRLMKDQRFPAVAE
jgi:type IV secretion system protein VirB10